jgi:hypothetical protein
MMQSGSILPALTCSLDLAFNCVLTGIAWTWPLHSRIRARHEGWTGYAVSGAVALSAGIVICATVTMVLGATGCCGGHAAWRIVLGLVSLAGIVAGVMADTALFKEYLRRALPLTGVFAVACTAVLLWPARGEWLLGGWDPGIYINEGAALSRTGTLRPDDDFFHRHFSEEEQAAFTRTGANRTERFPAVVVDAEHRAITYQFFRLTPALTGFLHRIGGLPAAFRLNTIVGILVALTFFAMMRQNGSPAHAAFGTLFLLTQPIWVYHLHTPVSEMLQLLMAVALCLVLPWRRERAGGIIALALLLFCLMLNRFSFLPFAAVFIAAVAWLDLERPDRGRVLIERAAQIGAVIAGGLVDRVVAPVSIVGWDILPTLVRVAGLGCAAALCLDAAALSPLVRARCRSLPPWTRWVAAAATLAALGYMYYAGGHNPKTPDSDNLYRLVPYLGALPALLAVAGGTLFLCRRDDAARPLGVYLLFLLAVSAAVLIRKCAADLYPWTTRRYLAFTVPAVAILAAWPMTWLWEREQHRVPCRVAALLGLLAVMGLQAKPVWHAWSRTEFNGITPVLAAAAGRIDDADIVVADHPWWGTPMLLTHGKQMLNGRHFYRREDEGTMQTGLAALARLHREGKCIRFLTSTEEGLGVYPDEVSPVTLDWSSDRIALEEISHHPRGNGFQTRHRQLVFRLYTWHPDA